MGLLLLLKVLSFFFFKFFILVSIGANIDKSTLMSFYSISYLIFSRSLDMHVYFRFHSLVELQSMFQTLAYGLIIKFYT